MTKSDSKKAVLHRLKIARGHLNKIIEMVEHNSYCVDVIHQSQAVQHALKETDMVILHNHLNSCTINHFIEGNAKKAIEEIMLVIRKGTK